MKSCIDYAAYIILFVLLASNIGLNLWTGHKTDVNGRTLGTLRTEQQQTIEYLNGRLGDLIGVEEQLRDTITELENGIRIAEEYRQETLRMGDRNTEAGIIGDQQERIIKELRRRDQQSGDSD